MIAGAIDVGRAGSWLVVDPAHVDQGACLVDDVHMWSGLGAIAIPDHALRVEEIGSRLRLGRGEDDLGLGGVDMALLSLRAGIDR